MVWGYICTSDGDAYPTGKAPLIQKVNHAPQTQILLNKTKKKTTFNWCNNIVLLGNTGDYINGVFGELNDSFCWFVLVIKNTGY